MFLFLELFLDKLQIYALEDIIGYLDFEYLKNSEEASPEWAEIFLNFGMWDKLVKRNVSSVLHFPFPEIMIDLIILDHNFQNREQSQWRKLKGAVTVSEEISQLDSNQVQRWICYDITRMIKVGHNQIISSF